MCVTVAAALLPPHVGKLLHWKVRAGSGERLFGYCSQDPKKKAFRHCIACCLLSEKGLSLQGKVQTVEEREREREREQSRVREGSHPAEGPVDIAVELQRESKAEKWVSRTSTLSRSVCRSNFHSLSERAHTHTTHTHTHTTNDIIRYESRT